MNTVNVIEMVDEQILKLAAFSDDPRGNKEAQDLFAACMRENGDEAFSEKGVRDALDEGNFEQGNYHLMLVHSTEPKPSQPAPTQTNP